MGAEVSDGVELSLDDMCRRCPPFDVRATGSYNDSMFTDHVRIYVKAGDGGNGMVALNIGRYLGHIRDILGIR